MKVLDIDVSGKLPDPFVFDSGKRVCSLSDWEKRKKEIYKYAVEMQYGTMPPPPEFIKVETLYEKSGNQYGKINSYRIISGRKDCPVSFIMQVFVPVKENFPKSGKCPAVIDGDGCFPCMYNHEVIATITNAGMYLVKFNRTEIVPDVKEDGKGGPLYKAYPEYTFGALGAWAWGYSRCVDALEILGMADMENIAFTGHSRGGKTALLAGVLDSRARFINPNGSGTGGSGCYRVRMKALTSAGEEKSAETLSNLLERFNFWFGPQLKRYIDREDKLPFDEHFLKVMLAPRVFLTSEAKDDIWANPVGTYLSSIASMEAWRMYKAEDNHLWHWRDGGHSHTVKDFEMLVNLMNNKIYGEKLQGGFLKIPFEKVGAIHDWEAPKFEK